MTGAVVGYRDTDLDTEPTVIVCANCAAGYDVSEMFPITREEADEYGDECSSGNHAL